MTHRIVDVTVKAGGREYTYEIPDMWLAGAYRTLGSVPAAINHWHEQAMMAEQFERERFPNGR